MAVEALATLVHLSLFFVGLLIYLFNINHTVLSSVGHRVYLYYRRSEMSLCCLMLKIQVATINYKRLVLHIVCVIARINGTEP